MHKIRYNIFLYIALILLFLYPLQFSQNYLLVVEKVADISSYFSGKKGIGTPRLFVQNDDYSVELESDQGIEDQGGVYSFTQLKGKYRNNDGLYILNSAQANYISEFNLLNFIQNFTIDSDDGEILGNQATYDITNNRFRAFSRIQFLGGKQEIIADSADLDLSDQIYNFVGNIEAYTKDQDGSIVRSNKAEIRRLDKVVILNEDVQIINDNELITADHVEISYVNGNDSEILVSEIKASGHIVYIDNVSGNKLEGNRLYAKYDVSDGSKSLLQKMIVEEDVVYISSRNQGDDKSSDLKGTLKGDKFTINFANAGAEDSSEIKSIFGEGSIKYISDFEVIESEYIFFDQVKNIIELTENVVVKREEGNFSGDIFTYNLATEEGELRSNSKDRKVNVEINQEVSNDK